MEELTKKSLLSIGPFFSLSPTEHESYLPPPKLFMSPSIADPHPPSPNAFGVVVLATIEKIAHFMSVLIVINWLLDTPFQLALLPNVTFAVDGDIPLDSVPSECVRFVINTDMWQTTVLLRCCPLNRRPISTQEVLLINLVLSRGALIEPGA